MRVFLRNSRSFVPMFLGAAIVFPLNLKSDGPPNPEYSLADYEVSGGRSVDTANAVNAPGVYAWKLFMNINRPARSVSSGKRGEPDYGKKLGDLGLSLWQTWKFADEVFLDNGHEPSAFDVAPPNGDIYSPLEPPKRMQLLAHQRGMKLRSTERLDANSSDPRISSLMATVNANPPSFEAELGKGEIRMNRETFNFIVANKLYNVDGQEEFRKTGATMIFPRGAIEVKASWVPLGLATDQNPRRDTYQCIVVNGTVYGLSGLHITTKDIPNWFWCTFEHYDNYPARFDDLPMSDVTPPNNNEFESFTPPEFKWKDINTGVVHTKTITYSIPKALQATRWRFYRLRGAQNDFTSPTGIPQRLANTQFEFLFEDTASCMSCHAKASIGDHLNVPPGTVVSRYGIIFDDGDNRLSALDNVPAPHSLPAMPRSNLGAPNPDLFGLDSFQAEAGQKPLYTQLDFVYSLYRARRWKP